MPSSATRPSRLAVSALLAAITSLASAQTTVNWTTTSPDGNTGNWSDPAKWGGTVPNGNFNAVFGAYANARTVTVDGVFAINKLTILPRNGSFSGQNFTLNASNGGYLQIGAGGLEIDNGNTVAFNAPVELTANQTWTGLTNNPSGSANFTAPISGNFTITRVGQNGGSFTFTGANTFGGFTSTSGTSRIGINPVVTGGVLSSSALGVGTLTLNGGILSSNGGAARTIHNPVLVGGNVTLGNATDNGALTFGSAGLNTPVGFNLSALANGTNRTLTINSPVTIDNVIGETGATRLGLIVGGSSTLTLNASKTYTGDTYTQGSATLVFGAATPQTGNAVAFGGTIQATGANRIVSGFLGAEGGEIRLGDSTNAAGISGRIGAFHGARVSSSGTLADLNSVLNPQSSVNYAITSASGAAFDQSALANGRSGLVNGTTGTLAYTGTLGAGNDGNFRLGGGLGTLSLPNTTLTGSSGLIVQGGGTLNVSGNQTHTGATVLNSNLTLSGANGALSGTSSITVNNGTLAIDNATNGGARLNDSAGITLNRGTLQVTTAAANGSLAESIGNLTFGGGIGTVTFVTAPTGGNRVYTTPSLTRENNALAFVRGDSFGPASSGGSLTNRNALVVTTAPTGANLVGGGGTTATNRSIIPWMLGGGFSGSNGASFVTFEPATNSLRILDTATEFVTTLAGSTDATDNVRQSLTASATILGGSKTVNSFILNGNNAGGGVTGTIASGQTLTVTSGAIHLNNSQNQTLTLTGGTIAFGGAPGVITSNGGGFLHTLGSVITGTGGVSFYAVNSSPLSITGNNTFSGGVTVGSIGSAMVAISNDNQLGASSNVVTHGGGTLRFYNQAAAGSTRNYVLLGGVGDNTIDMNVGSAANHTLGAIGGAGRLRLVNTGAAGNSLTLDKANTYSGGTQVDSGTLIVAHNSGLGSGSLAVNGGAVNFTSAAPSAGALFSTTGGGASTTVTLGNANTSSTTLTLGANNDSGIYSGTIGETAAGRGALVKSGAGVQVLTGHHTFTGGSTVNGGTLTIAGSLASGAAVAVNSGATLDGNGSVGATTLSGGTLGGTLTLASLATSGGALASGANLTVTNGLAVNGGTLAGPGALSVSGGSVTGSGTINAPISFGAGVTVAPGNSPGTLAFGNGFTFAGTYAWELDGLTTSGPGTNFDQIVVTGGDVNIAGASLSLDLGAFAPSADAFWTGNRSWTILDAAGAGSVAGTFTITNDQSVWSEWGSFSTITNGAGVELQWTSAIPEPSAFAGLAGLGALGFAALRRRRRA